MSANEDITPVFDASLIQKADSAPETPVKEHQVRKPAVHKTAKAEASGRISELRSLHRKEVQELKARQKEQVTALQKSLKEQAAKSKEELRKAEVETKKFYEGQLKQLRSDYSSQNERLREELRSYLEGAVSEIAKEQESRLARESDERIDSLREMINADFVAAMQAKQQEFDQTKALLDAEIARLEEESDGRKHRIAQLETKMKELSHYLPEDVQHELYEQFGFAEDLKILEEAKPKRKGFFSKLMSLF